jgi:hypothetical protein
VLDSADPAREGDRIRAGETVSLATASTLLFVTDS